MTDKIIENNQVSVMGKITSGFEAGGGTTLLFFAFTMRKITSGFEAGGRVQVWGGSRAVKCQEAG